MRSWGSWNPWRELRARDHIVFELNAVAGIAGGAIYCRRGDLAAIVIDPALDPVHRRAALAHELVHDERGMVRVAGAPVELWVIAGREEHRVDVIVAERLVRAEDLAELVRSRVDVEPITAAVVADEFGVPVAVALQALQLLAHRRGTDPELHGDAAATAR